MEGKERSKSKEIKIRNKARTSKFVVFDKHKVSNIRCSKNSSDCMIFKNVENKYGMHYIFISSYILDFLKIII